MDLKYCKSLVLNADFNPVKIHPLSLWSFERTLRNFLKDRIVVLETHDITLSSQNWSYQPPSVVALKSYIKLPQKVTFSLL